MTWWLKLILMKRIKDLLKQNHDLGVEIKHERYERIKVNDNRIKFHYSLLEGAKDKVIYWFHGFMSDETSFYDPSFFSTKGWIATHKLLEPKPTIICISFDKSWLISDEEKRRRGERDATLTNIKGIMAYLEEKYDISEPKRVVAGTSMGGWNACKMYLHEPQLWDAAALHVPMMVPPGGNSGIVKLLTGGEFKDEDWPKQNILDEAQKYLTSEHPMVHIQASVMDQFGFYEPDKQLVELLKSKGIKVMFTENDGDHADMNPRVMAEMLEIFLK